ncbi:MAG: HPr family phosphocarrier protein [Gammaproteobacteria bacterium]|nr:HPr family phosphocarrier protein [Gammaproteobacteria bacterium]
MIEERVVVANKLGIHARSASRFVAVAKSFPCSVRIGLVDSDLQNGKSIMGVLRLAAERGATLVLQTSGDKEREAMNSLKELVADRFGEPE